MNNPVTCDVCGTVVEAPIEDVRYRIATLEAERDAARNSLAEYVRQAALDAKVK